MGEAEGRSEEGRRSPPSPLAAAVAGPKRRGTKKKKNDWGEGGARVRVWEGVFGCVNILSFRALYLNIFISFLIYFFHFKFMS